MQFKTDTLRSQYRTKKLCLPLRETCLVLEILARRAGRPEGITITSLYRPKDADSYHSKWQAIDIRNRDWPPTLHASVFAVLVAIRELDVKCQFEVEADHLHLEYDDQSLQKVRKI